MTLPPPLSSSLQPITPLLCPTPEGSLGWRPTLTYPNSSRSMDPLVPLGRMDYLDHMESRRPWDLGKQSLGNVGRGWVVTGGTDREMPGVCAVPGCGVLHEHLGL